MLAFTTVTAAGTKGNRRKGLSGMMEIREQHRKARLQTIPRHKLLTGTNLLKDKAFKQESSFQTSALVTYAMAHSNESPSFIFTGNERNDGREAVKCFSKPRK